MFFALFISTQNSSSIKEESADKTCKEQWIMFQGERMMAFHPLLTCTSNFRSHEGSEEERNDSTTQMKRHGTRIQ